MHVLNKDQILQIKKDLKSRKIASGYRDELLDHICHMIESKMDYGIAFNIAHKEVLEDFGSESFDDLNKQSPLTIKKRKMVITQLTGALVAATLFVFVTGASTQEPPAINPINDLAEISSHFGMRLDPRSKTQKHHRGIDFRCSVGTPVKATANGEVYLIEEAEGGYGKRIEIKHDENYLTRYAHLSDIQVKKGDKVKSGQIIGLSGNSGWSTAPHLHYEVIKDGKPVNPENYFGNEEQE